MYVRVKDTSIDGRGGMWYIRFLIASQLEFSLLADHPLPPGDGRMMPIY